MTNVTMQVEKAVKLQCAHCGGEDVAVDFSVGFIHANGGDTGYLKFHCEDCDKETDITEE